MITTQPTVRLMTGASSVRGGRATNEDAFHVGERLIAVADGVGGGPAGEVASRLTVDQVAAAGPDQPLTRTVALVNTAVRDHGRSDPQTTGMATTLEVVALQRDADGWWVRGAHVGDSLALMQRDTAPEALTRAHSLASEMVAAGDLTAEQAARHPLAGALARAVGLATTVRPDLWQQPALPGTRFVLSSDGLPDALGPDRCFDLLAALREVPPQECVQRLVAAALAAGAHDNVTVVVADVVAESEAAWPS